MTDGAVGLAQSRERASEAVAHFERRLRFETDVSDVHAAMESGAPGFVLVDTRSQVAWDQGHLPGALHLPTALIPTRARQLIPAGTPGVTYCWGPGCNGATKAALAFAQLGYEVREMLGGYEYWVREGFPVETSSGRVKRPVPWPRQRADRPATADGCPHRTVGAARGADVRTVHGAPMAPPVRRAVGGAPASRRVR